MFKNTRLWAIMLIVAMLGMVFAGCAKTTEKPPLEPKQEQQSQQPKEKEPANKEVILATTTSTVDSGLLDVLKPEFEKETGYNLTVVSVGSGAAIKMAEKGEADALLVHSPKDEERIEDAGIVIGRQLVMHNDFVIIGPPNDPAGIKGKPSVEAFKLIARKKCLFLSRGDESGTHKKELSIWKQAGITPAGAWYQQTGTGMGQTIGVAAEKNGYTLSDRATYLAQKKNSGLQILSEGDKALLNIYHVMQVNPKKFSKVNAEGGKAFVDFMLSEKTQALIKNFGVDKFGQPLFVPDAGKKEEQLGR
ncbi:substrate-binding domain-containing protein [Thermincola potens]|uniref:ABC-type tungstate transport system, permease component n=1 Tax=Thermincola potens (strain JR) TaxID=635013 RepID=D5XCN3_THEPJ|nr:substrate-binding domain-containing protein [Thermincola potens]ADG81659.1 ABC-type tungstate transport system, permease component [Thermincola potens JR]